VTQYNRVLRQLAATTIAGGLLLAQQPVATDLLDQAAAKAAELCRSGRYAEAAEVMKPAVQAAEKAGPSARLAMGLTLLGTIYHNQCRYSEGERVLRRAMRIWEGNPASDRRGHLGTAIKLAVLYSETRRFALSERLLRQHLSIWRDLDADSFEVAEVLHDLGYAQEGQRRYAEAESSYRESLAILQRLTGHDDEVADVLTTLGDFQLRTGRHREALENLERALAIHSRLHSEAHPDTLELSLSLARVYVEIDRPLEAEQLLKQGLVTANATIGPEHPLTGIVLMNYARVLGALGRHSESAKMEREGKAILEKFPLLDRRRYTVDLSELLSEQGRR